MPTLAGKTLGRYRLDASQGMGGMAEVYRATDGRLGRTVAVKVVLPAYAAEPQFRERFLREARLVAALEHPNILPVYDFGEEDQLPFLVMPFIERGSLAERLAAGPLPLAAVARWIGEMASALDAAHGAGILHRDVKPSNVLLDKAERALLADFGIAQAAGAATRLTATGSVVGTPAYMAPELAQGEPASPASDRYALAVLAFELLAGRAPYEGESALSLLHQHVASPVPAVTSKRPGLPRDLDLFFERALAKRPAERHPNCRAMADELFVLLRPTAETLVPMPTLGVEAAERAGGPPRTGASGPALSSAMTVLTAPGSGSWGRRLLGAATAVAAVALAGFLLLRMGSPGAGEGSSSLAGAAGSDHAGAASRDSPGPSDSATADGRAGQVAPRESAAATLVSPATGPASGSRPPAAPVPAPAVGAPPSGAAPRTEVGAALGQATGGDLTSDLLSDFAAEEGESGEAEAPGAGAPRSATGDLPRADARPGSGVHPRPPFPRRDRPLGALRPRPGQPPGAAGGAPSDSASPTKGQRAALRLAEELRAGGPATEERFHRLEAMAAGPLGRKPGDSLALAIQEYARGGLAYLRGEDAAARRALAQLDAFAALPDFLLAAGPLWVLRDREAAAPLADWEVAIAYADARGDGKAAVDAHLGAHPDDARALYCRAFLHRLHGRHREAIEDARQAHERVAGAEPGKAAALAVFLGEEHAALGLYAEALGWYRRALAGGGKGAGGLALHAGRLAEEKLGDPKAAAELYRLGCEAGNAVACRRAEAGGAPRP